MSAFLDTLKKLLGRTAPAAVDAAQWARVERRLPFLDYLSAGERARLRAMALDFIAGKEWYGAQGLALTPDIQLAIALQACLPILELGLDSYAGWVGVIVYPGDFVIARREMSDDGVLHEFDHSVAGEAWQGGPVLLSWFERPEEADGMNVVLHEFAHKLDMLNGPADGFPPLHEGMNRAAWSAAFSQAYDDFCARVDADEAGALDAALDLPLDPYAAESPAEFFAVTSEAFFETPAPLRAEYPAVYAQLRQFYRQDPLR